MDETLGRRREVAAWGRRSVWAAVVAGVAGCAQVLGIDGYGPEQDAAGIAVDTSDDAEVDAPEATDGAVTEAAPAGDGGVEISGDSAAKASTGEPAVHDAAAETSKGPKGGAPAGATTKQPVGPPADAAIDRSTPEGSAADARSADGTAANASGVDAAIEAETGSPGGCPAPCNGGCNLGTCVITVTSGGMGNVSCPPGVPCEVQCQGNKACHGVVTCAASQPCWVVCNDGQTCINWQIAGSSPSALCVDCSGDSDLGDSCSVACQGPGCKGPCGN